MLQFLKDLFRTGYLGGRSGMWRYTRKCHIKIHPLCCACGRKGTRLKPNEVHHIKDFSHYPELENDPTNLKTMCRRCHQLLGHLDNFRSINTNVVDDCAWMRDKITARP